MLLVVLATAGKILAAMRLDLFGDEAFYWLCAHRLAIGFVDHPPLTAILLRLGTELWGDTTLGVRFSSLVIGAAFPFAIYAMARTVVGELDAWLAAGLSLAVPGLAHLGVIAIPDVPMLLLTALFLLAFERATRTGSAGFWLLAGVSGALGLCTHYRFVLAVVAAACYLALTPLGRRRLRDRRLYLAAAILSLGFVPSIVVNLNNDMAPLYFQLVSRHGGRMAWDSVPAFFAAQAALVTPLLFVALLATLWRLLRRARAGDDRAALFVCFALVPLGVFLVASPFDASKLATEHWPMPGYLPLLVYLPDTLRQLVRRRPTRLRRALAVSTPALGLACVLILLLQYATGWLHITALERPFFGWSELKARMEGELLQPFEASGTGPVLVVADNYILGANLEFELGDRIDTYVLDHLKNHEHGRAEQLHVWGIDEDALASRAGEDALVIVQVRKLDEADRAPWIEHVASLFDSLEPLGEARFYTGRHAVRFRFFRGSGIR